jgi:hypothetical protein
LALPKEAVAKKSRREQLFFLRSIAPSACRPDAMNLKSDR